MENLILKNFEQAATSYNDFAPLQRSVAWQLARHCNNLNLPCGTWVDLGAGTGLLAEALEADNPTQKVIRVDNSPKMLSLQRVGSSTKLWNLNLGPPPLSQDPVLLASSFALQWLTNPEKRLEEWFSALAPRGWLAIALPIKGSFKEWYKAAEIADVTCTALNLPCYKSLIKSLKRKHIHFQKIHTYSQTASKAIELLKPIAKIGANASPNKPLNIREWRQIERSWPRSQKHSEVKLTWKVLMLLAKNE